MDMHALHAMFGGGGRAGGIHAMLQQLMGGHHGHGHMQFVGNVPPHFMQQINAMGPGRGAQRAATDAESKVNALIADLPTRTLDCDDVPAIDLTADSDDDAAGANEDKKGVEKEESSCMVCLDGWNAGEEVSMLPCFHQFHKKCVQSWWVRKAKDAAMSSGHANDRAGRAVCPCCRSDVVNTLAQSREAFKATESGKKSKSKKKKRKRRPNSTGRQPPAQVRAVASSSSAASATRPARVVVSVPRQRHDIYISDDYDEEMDSDYLGEDDADDDEDDEDSAAQAREIASRNRRHSRRERRAAVSARGGASSVAAAVAASSGSATASRAAGGRGASRAAPRGGSRAVVRASASDDVVLIVDSSDDAAPVRQHSQRNSRQRRQIRGATGGGGGGREGSRASRGGRSGVGTSASNSPPGTPQSPDLVMLSSSE